MQELTNQTKTQQFDVQPGSTVLITGGAGFIGSNFVHSFLKNYPNVKVINFDKLTYCGNLENLDPIKDNPRYTFVKGDICNEDHVTHVMQGVDVVIHFAAESHVDNSIKDPFIFTRTNVLGTHVLLEAARKCNVKRFVHVSTDEVYGSIEDGSFTESDKLKPSSPYSASKAAAELVAQGFRTTFKMPIVIVRGSNAFGPYQYPEKFMPLFITNLLEGKKVPLYGDGLHVRSWVYVHDFCSAVDRVLTHGEEGEAYNIPGTCEMTNMATTHKMLSLLDKDQSHIEHVEDRLAHDRRYSVDGTKLRALGWQPEYDFERAMKEKVEWYRNNEAWWRKLKQ